MSSPLCIQGDFPKQHIAGKAERVGILQMEFGQSVGFAPAATALRTSAIVVASSIIKSAMAEFAFLAAGARDDLAEQLKGCAIKFLKLHLLDRSEIVCAGVDSDAGQ